MKSFFIISFFFISNIIFSAPPPPPTGSPNCWPPPCVPIDNGVIFLIIAGTALVFKEVYDLRKKQQATS